MKKGIDVSYAQLLIDWTRVRPQIDFAIIRAGYGQGHIDDYAARNIAECARLNIPFGIYWFSYALDENAAIREADACLNVVNNYSVLYPIFIDYEYDSTNYARKSGVPVTKQSVTKIIASFCETIQASGHKPGYYSNEDYLNNFIDSSALSDYKLWYAHYAPDNNIPCAMWQYTNDLLIDGISVKVDGDYSNEEYDKAMTVDEARQLVQTKANLSDATMQFLLDDYRFGSELILKLANAINKEE